MRSHSADSEVSFYCTALRCYYYSCGPNCGKAMKLEKVNSIQPRATKETVHDGSLVVTS